MGPLLREDQSGGTVLDPFVYGSHAFGMPYYMYCIRVSDTPIPGTMSLKLAEPAKVYKLRRGSGVRARNVHNKPSIRNLVQCIWGGMGGRVTIYFSSSAISTWSPSPFPSSSCSLPSSRTQVGISGWFGRRWVEARQLKSQSSQPSIFTFRVYL